MTHEILSHRQQGAILRDQRRVLVASAYLRGQDQRQIAAALGCHQSTVSRDLLSLRAEWRACSASDYSDTLALVLAKLDLLERTLWLAWQRSIEPFHTRTLRGRAQPADEDGAEWPQTIERVERTENRCGDPRYLQGVMDCISERCRLLGLYAPTGRHLTAQDQPPGITIIEVIKPADSPVEPTDELAALQAKDREW